MNSLESRTEQIIVVLLLCISLVSFRLPFGLAGPLELLEKETLEPQSNRTELIDFINRSDIYVNLAWLTPEEKIERKNILNDIVPTLSVERLEEVAREIRNNGTPFEAISEAKEEQLASSLDTCISNPNLC